MLIPAAFSSHYGTPDPLFETDVPERKNQNTQLVKYLFHFACSRQGRFGTDMPDFRS
ncbi:hypothetical protein MPLB_20064 [Mesorhizobium sp. ORS 3324]|nr:hypothetical protein MPLB_20064 [Mesorhizobium sp. ORS 3324]